MNEPSRILRFERRVPDGDNRERLVCGDCGFVAYENPKIIVGSVVTQGDRFLICRRAIPPRLGYWTIPAGFMELGESPEEGAAREAEEEACAKIAIRELLGVYTVRHLSQVQMIFRAELVGDHFAPGPESTEVRLVPWEEIPWDELAFPSVLWALEDHRAALRGEPALPVRRASDPGAPKLE